MSENFCICLPFLHANVSNADNLPDMFLRLSPGFENVSGSWMPPDYVFTKNEAANLLASMREADIGDLESMRILLNPGMTAAQSGFRSEMDDLARFATGEDGGPSLKVRTLLEQAQKILLWIWLQEEVWADIASLSRQCASKDASLRGQFTESPAVMVDHAEKMFEPDATIMPSWRICAANAALFVPPGIPFFIEGAMRDEMLEDFSFKPAKKAPISWSESLPPEMLYISAPLWKILRHSRPDTHFVGEEWDAFNGFYNIDRIWLAWGEK